MFLGFSEMPFKKGPGTWSLQGFADTHCLKTLEVEALDLCWANTLCGRVKKRLGPPVVPFYPFLGEGSPTKLDYRKKVGTLILTSQIWRT